MANIIKIITTALEKISNKQNSLATDATNEKYPTVTAVNTGLSGKLTKPTGSATTQYLDGLGAPKNLDTIPLKVGTQPSSGTNGRVFYQDGGVLSQNSGMFYESSFSTLNLLGGLFVGDNSSTRTVQMRIMSANSANLRFLNAGNLGYEIRCFNGSLEFNNTQSNKRTVVISRDSEADIFSTNVKNINLTKAGDTGKVGVGWPNTYTVPDKVTIVGQGNTSGTNSLSTRDYLLAITMLMKDNGTLNLPKLPTSATGLVAGDVWRDGTTLKIV